MAFRKIIKFGESSHVITLPKPWLVKNSLSKGDTIFLEHSDDEIKITSQNKEPTKELKEFTINIDDSPQLREQLAFTYINNYDTIHIIGAQLENNLERIKRLITQFMAFEIIQQTSKRVTIKDLLNIRDINLFDILRRMDRIIESMFENAQQHLEGENKTETIMSKEDDVNKLTYLTLKVLRKALDPQHRKQLNLTLKDILYISETVTHLEATADHLKRIPRHTNEKVNPKIITLFKQIHSNYTTTLKSHYKKERSIALEVKSLKNSLLRPTDACFKIATPDESLILEKMSNIIRSTIGVAHAVIAKPL